MIRTLIGNLYPLKLIIPLLIFGSCLTGQEFDPYTGELVVQDADTTETPTQIQTPTYDPHTGEEISIKPDTHPSQTKPMVQRQYDPETGLPVVTGQSLSICDQAKADAIETTSEFWYAGGVVYFIGVPVLLLSSPDPPDELIKKVKAEDVMQYVKCYKLAAKKEKSKRMLTGCGVYILIGILLF